MGFKCCVLGCKSGFSSNNNKKKCSFFKFPSTNQELRNLWIRKIHRVDFQPTEYSRVCSIHFRSNDFELERKDSNTRRKRSKGNLKLLKLKLIPLFIQANLGISPRLSFKNVKPDRQQKQVWKMKICS